MATKDTVVQELVVNTLTHKQFKAAQEAGTLSPYELYGTPDTSVRLPVLTPMWFDHLANDVSWLRADTFSWQSGDVYVAAYEHLVADLDGAVGVAMYAWYNPTYGLWFTLSENPSVGDYAYSFTDTTNKTINQFDIISSVVSGASISLGGDVFERRSTGDKSNVPGIDTFPTVDGYYVNVSYMTAQDGHKICLPNQEINISALYDSTGVAWYYILDTVNKQFKLPRSKHNKYADTVPVVGTGKSIGFTPVNKAFSGNNALYPNSAAIGETRTVYQANTAAGLGLSTDSNLSEVFAQQAQDTDQYKYLYFYVGNYTRDAVEQTAGITSEILNSKLDIGAGNATAETKATIVGWGMPDYSAGVVVADGYQTTFPCFVTLIQPAVVASNSAVVIRIDGEISTLSVTGGNVSKRLGTSCCVDAGHTITTDGSDGSPVLTVYPLKGVNQ